MENQKHNQQPARQYVATFASRDDGERKGFKGVWSHPDSAVWVEVKHIDGAPVIFETPEAATGAAQAACLAHMNKRFSGAPVIGFDNFEISQVVEYYNEDKTQSFCEVFHHDNIEEERKRDDYKADFWTLYGHIPNAGVAAIGDFTSEKDAEEIRDRILYHTAKR